MFLIDSLSLTVVQMLFIACQHIFDVGRLKHPCAQAHTEDRHSGLQRGVRHRLLPSQGGSVQGLGEDLQDGRQEQSLHRHLRPRHSHPRQEEPQVSQLDMKYFPIKYGKVSKISPPSMSGLFH